MYVRHSQMRTALDAALLPDYLGILHRRSSEDHKPWSLSAAWATTQMALARLPYPHVVLGAVFLCFITAQYWEFLSRRSTRRRLMMAQLLCFSSAQLLGDFLFLHGGCHRSGRSQSATVFNNFYAILAICPIQVFVLLHYHDLGASSFKLASALAVIGLGAGFYGVMLPAFPQDEEIKHIWLLAVLGVDLHLVAIALGFRSKTPACTRLPWWESMRGIATSVSSTSALACVAALLPLLISPLDLVAIARLHTAVFFTCFPCLGRVVATAPDLHDKEIVDQHISKPEL